MPRLVTAKDIQKARSEWYPVHFDARKMAAAYPQQVQASVARMLEIVPRPRLNIYGGLYHGYFDDPQIWPEVLRIARTSDHDVLLMVWWYWSDPGWADFQEQWKALPEELRPFTGQPYKEEVVHIYPQPVDKK